MPESQGCCVWQSSDSHKMFACQSGLTVFTVQSDYGGFDRAFSPRLLLLSNRSAVRQYYNAVTCTLGGAAVVLFFFQIEKNDTIETCHKHKYNLQTHLGFLHLECIKYKLYIDKKHFFCSLRQQKSLFSLEKNKSNNWKKERTTLVPKISHKWKRATMKLNSVYLYYIIKKVFF